MKAPRLAGRFVPSVTSSAGIGDFACVKGRSGRRYVFSAITAGQEDLYDNAIFAVIDETGSMILRDRHAPSGAARNYVHILDREDIATIIDDLTFRPGSSADRPDPG